MKRYILQRKSDGKYFKKGRYPQVKWVGDKNKATLYQHPRHFQGCLDYYTQFEHLRKPTEYWMDFISRFKSGFEKWYQENYIVIEVNFELVSINPS